MRPPALEDISLLIKPFKKKGKPNHKMAVHMGSKNTLKPKISMRVWVRLEKRE